MPEINQAKTKPIPESGLFDEKTVIARVHSGDKDAFSEIAVQYQDRLYNAVYRMVNSADDALDICQEVFLKAFLSIDSFRGDSSFLTYLYRIAFNESITYRNQRKKMIPVDFKSNPQVLAKKEATGDNTNHTAGIQTKESNEQIQDILNSLEPELRKVVVLKDIEAFSYAEVAQTLNISVSTVRTNLSKAREILREKLKTLI